MAVRSRLNPQVLFLHIGWARNYRGDPGDLPQGKFGYIKSGNTDMGDALNFKAYRGRCYGYAPHHNVTLRKLGAAPDADHVDRVLVVWTATNSDGSGRYVVGWYKNARVYASMQQIRPDDDRPGCIAVAAAADCHLLSVDERTLFVPCMSPGWPGTRSAYYPGDHLTPKQVDELVFYVNGAPSTGFYHGWPPPPDTGHGRAETSPEDRKKVEEAAVTVVKKYYEPSWSVARVGHLNEGWDLRVTQGHRLLLVEVKGRGGQGAIELTPNEYSKMQDTRFRMLYRLAIVFHALSASPRLTIFSYAPGKKEWVSDAGDVLTLEEAISASAGF